MVVEGRVAYVSGGYAIDLASKPQREKLLKKIETNTKGG